jgi:hypothetical protein
MTGPGIRVSGLRRGGTTVAEPAGISVADLVVGTVLSVADGLTGVRAAVSDGRTRRGLARVGTTR